MHEKQIVIVFIRNSEGAFFVHQRLPTKKSFPNMYGIGAGGHVEAGEDISAAASRELREETSLSAPVEYICTENFETPGDAWTAHLFVVDSNDSIDTDESEWQWSGWVDKVGVDQLYREGKLCMDTGVLYQKYLESTLKK